MKKLLTIFSLSLVVFSSNAQGLFDRVSEGTTSTLIRNNAFDKKDANISGVPYLDDKFYLADISGVAEKVLVRYNSATDEIEIKKDQGDQEFLLPKTPEYNTIVTKFGKYVLKNVYYTTSKGENVNGYLVEIFANDAISLLRRDKVKVEDAREGNGYTGYIPAKYVKANPEYFIKLKDQDAVSFPKNKKAIIEMYSGKKSEIDAFFKANKLSWNNEDDMAKISQFIATL
ncbi:hypothetical protein FLAN108750_03585 [Flavobacterium antarcticum]|uniref:hypothetical protein n=1 Tax=Flavobacterium antarcticum TaxID=271155 RepID=UPI0003B6B4B6|nr:hypothetical protein [Flavobacterium antarcticum]